MTTYTRVRRWVASAVILGFALGGAACGSSAPSGSAKGGPIEVEISPFFVTVSNRSGTAITDVKLEVFPPGRQMVFSATHFRLESNADKDFSMNDLRGSDGTPFNLRVHRPRTVRVTAMGIDGTAHEVELDW